LPASTRSDLKAAITSSPCCKTAGRRRRSTGACQFAGIIVTPLNWRSSAEELDFCIDDAEAKAIVYEEVSAAAVRASNQARARPRIAIGEARAQDLSFDSLIGGSAPAVRPRVTAEA